MTTVAYALGRPPAADMRGGDCRARDLDQGRNVHGPHRFAATTHAQINNGLLRLTVGAAGAAPSLTVEARRGRVTVGDVYESVYRAKYSSGSAIGSPEWLAVGAITIDSPSVSALLTAVQVVRINPQAVTIRLVAPLMADAYVTLKRGMRAISIQHGSTRGTLVSTSRRVRLTATPSPVGTAYTNRVQEVSAAVGLDGLHRFVGSLDPATADAGAFSLTAASVTTARFGFGVGTTNDRDGARDLHSQLGDTSRPRLVVA